MGTELEVDVISDGTDVLIPGIMEHVERAGIHSGDSIAVYPPYSLDDKMINTVCTSSEKLALALGTKGLVNIQYLIFQKRAVCHRGQPAGVEDSPLYKQGDRCAYGRACLKGHDRVGSRVSGLRDRSL